MKLLYFEGEFKHVGRCTCGKTWNPPGVIVREATIEDVSDWALERDYELISAYDERLSDAHEDIEKWLKKHKDET